MGVAKVHWACTCRKHGTEEKGGSGVRWVKVGVPKGKKRRQNEGCPKCKAEFLAEKKLAEKSV